MTQAVPVDFGKFEALHAAFWQGGTFLYVPKDVAVELPFRSFSHRAEPGAAVFTHTLVVVEEGAEAFFVDAFQLADAGGAVVRLGVVELILGQDSKLRYVQVQDWGRHVWNFMTERAILGNDATLNSLHVTLGSSSPRTRSAPTCAGRTRWRRCSASSSPTATSSSTTTPGSCTSRRTRPATWSSRAR